MQVIRSPRVLCMPDEYFSSKLAAKYGLIEAIVISNISRAIVDAQRSGECKVVDGHAYVKCALETLHSWIPYISESTLKRAVSKLVKCGVFAKGAFNETRMDHTSWFAIVDL